MTNERKRDEQAEPAITNLPSQAPKDEQADEVRGGAGKVSQQDFHFVMRNNSASPTLF